MSEEKLSIKDIRGLVKGNAPKKEEKPAAAKEAEPVNPDKQEVKTVKKEVKKDKPLKEPVEGSNSNKLDKFFAYVEEVNKIDDFNIGKTIHVDVDVHEILQSLKGSEVKLHISKLASHLLTEFIKDNKEEIVEILKRKSNKFLD